MSIGVHDFAIPHEHVQPTRDMVIVRMPLPPKKIGNIIAPEMFRDMAQYNVMAGRIVALGPLAFCYKDVDGLKRQTANVGDWVTFRPFAGTYTQGGKVAGVGSWRYISSFSDVIGIIPAVQMPDPATLLWDEDASQQAAEGGAVILDPKAAADADFKFDSRKPVESAFND